MVVLSRPYILTEVVDLADSVLIVYRPGVTAGARAVVDALFVSAHYRALWQLPKHGASSEAARRSAMDIEDPL